MCVRAGKRVFGCIIFTAVFFDVFRFGGLKKPRAGFFQRICGNADIVAVATIANDVKDAIFGTLPLDNMGGKTVGNKFFLESFRHRGDFLF